MAWFFGDSWDLYGTPVDAYGSGTYWDSGNNSFNLVPGRFSGSRGIQGNAAVFGTPFLLKSSGSNDSVHHINVAFQQTNAISGTSINKWFTLSDGATAQCTVYFRNDGAIVLAAGLSTGTVLATYTGAFTAANTWYGFEIEVVVSNTAGSMTVRKSGNTSNDFASATNLDTAATANNYANRLGIGNGSTTGGQQLDDFLWRSDTSAVPWVGELRCYTRMPASDAAVQWTPSGAVVPMANFPDAPTSNTSLSATQGRYLPFVPPCDGTVGTLSLQCGTAATMDVKCTIFASAAGAPTTILGSATLVSNPTVGTTTFTFPTPVAVLRGVTYYAGFSSSSSIGAFAYLLTGPPSGGYAPLQNTLAYASFPAANPTALSASTNYKMIVNITPTGAVNAPFVADPMQDAGASYVSSSTIGQSDYYGVTPISGTPTGIIGVTTRALAQKSDAGTRSIALKLKSGATDVTGTSTALNTSFSWVWRNDLVDPATGVAWTAVAVNNLQVGQTLSA